MPISNRGHSSNRGLTAVLDIGSSKIACVVVQPMQHAAPRWVGLGVRPAEGIRCGEVADASDAAPAILGAIADAERSAGAPVTAIVVGVGGGRMASVQATASAVLDPTIVRETDVRRLLRAAAAYAERNGRTRLHDEHLGYRVDGVWCEAEPIDRFGRRLDLESIAITADTVPLQRLMTIAEASGVPVVAVVPLPLAAVLSVTTPAERRHGVTVVDLGAGLTSMVTFVDGRPTRIATVCLGGRQLTQDVAAALQVTFSSAERIKHECATVAPAHAGEPDTSAYRLDSGSDADVRQATDLRSSGTAAMRGALHEIVAPRIDAVLRHVADHLDAVSVTTSESGCVVLTGGSSLLNGLPAYAAQILGRLVRLGRPPALAGLGSVGVAPFAALAGLAVMTGQAEFGQSAFGSTLAGHRRVA